MSYMSKRGDENPMQHLARINPMREAIENEIKASFGEGIVDQLTMAARTLLNERMDRDGNIKFGRLKITVELDGRAVDVPLYQYCGHDLRKMGEAA